MNVAVAQYQSVALNRDVKQHQLCAGDMAYLDEGDSRRSG